MSTDQCACGQAVDTCQSGMLKCNGKCEKCSCKSQNEKEVEREDN